MEGGVDPEEYYWYTQVDRVNTTATVWLGSTLAAPSAITTSLIPSLRRITTASWLSLPESSYIADNDDEGSVCARSHH